MIPAGYSRVFRHFLSLDSCFRYGLTERTQFLVVHSLAAFLALRALDYFLFLFFFPRSGRGQIALFVRTRPREKAVGKKGPKKSGPKRRERERQKMPASQTNAVHHFCAIQRNMSSRINLHILRLHLKSYS